MRLKEIIVGAAVAGGLAAAQSDSPPRCGAAPAPPPDPAANDAGGPARGTPTRQCAGVGTAATGGPLWADGNKQVWDRAGTIGASG